MLKEAVEYALLAGIAVSGTMAFVNWLRSRSHNALMRLGVDYAAVMSRGGTQAELNEELQRAIPDKDVALQWRVRRAGVTLTVARPQIRYTCDIEDRRDFWRVMARRSELPRDVRSEIAAYESALASVAPYFFNTRILRI